MTTLQTKFAILEKSKGQKYSWSAITKYNLLQKLIGTTPDQEMYLVVKDAKNASGQIIQFSVGCQQVVTALASKYFKGGKWTA